MGNFFKGIVKNRTMLILFLAVSALVVLNILLPEDPSAPPETTAATSPAPAEESPYAGVICISELMTKPGGAPGFGRGLFRLDRT